jgi:hypothetical protein
MQLYPNAVYVSSSGPSTGGVNALYLSRPLIGERFYCVKRAARFDSNFLQRAVAAVLFTHEVF